jgi:hypothetical protein
MQRSVPGRRRTRSALAIALAGTAAGVPACRSWRAEPLPRVAGGAPAPERVVRGPVRVTRLDGRRAELAEARVAGDTVRGPLRGRPATGGAATVAVPLDSVRALHTRRFSPGRTAGLAAGLLAAWVALAYVALSVVALPAY